LKGSYLPVLHHPKASFAMSDISSPEFVSPILRSVDQNVVNKKDRQSTEGSGKVNSLNGKSHTCHQPLTKHFLSIPTDHFASASARTHVSDSTTVGDDTFTLVPAKIYEQLTMI
jgi:hypothetical protein